MPEDISDRTTIAHAVKLPENARTSSGSSGSAGTGHRSHAKTVKKEKVTLSAFVKNNVQVIRAERRRFTPRKRLTYLSILAGGILILIVAAILLFRQPTQEEKYEKYYEKGLEYYDAGNYSSALTNLRKASDIVREPECVKLMAECYYEQGNYTKALELLRTLDVSDSEIADKIQLLESLRLQERRASQLYILGSYFDETAVSASFDGLALDSSDLSKVTALYSLEELSLSHNSISDISRLSSLGGLTSLDLSYNLVSDVSPLAVLSALTELNLSGNPIADFVPLYALTGLTSLILTDVDISGEALYDLSCALPSCVIITGTADSEQRSIGGVSFDTSVTELDLSGSGLTDISVLSSCKNLVTLNLSGNNISDLSPLMNIQGLETLIISGNAVTELYPLMGMTSLRTIVADNNSISSLMPVSALSSLTSLNVSYNPISDFGGIENLKFLENLELAGTGLTDESLEMIDEIYSLKTLVLSDNPDLTGDGVDALDARLKNCKITHDKLPYYVDVEGTKYLDNITELDLSGTGITRLNFILDFNSLEYLNLSGNGITNIYIFEYSTNIKSIDLSGNQISDISALQNIYYTEYLNLADNQITSLGALAFLTNLKELDLSGNPLPQDQILYLCNCLPNCVIHY